MTSFKSRTYEKPKPKAKMVLVTCAGCLARYHITIVGFANEYIDLVRTTKCQKCDEVKLATSDLAKTKVRAKTLQLSLDFKKGGTHDSLERKKR